MIGYLDATDEMYGVIKSVLLDDTRWPLLLGYTMDVRWPGDALGTKPDMTRLWARVSKQVVKDSQSALANANGQRVFETIGLLYVQLFCPRNQPATLQNGSNIAVAMQAAFREQSPSGEIWFLNQAIREMPETPENYPITVVTEFRYKVLDPIGGLTGAGVLSQRTVTGVVDGVNKVFVISGSPVSLLWFIDGLCQRLDQYSYVDGIVTTVAAPTMGSELLAIGE